MKVTKFAQLICKEEGKKKEVSIAQVMEVLKVINGLLKRLINVDLYFLIRNC